MKKTPLVCVILLVAGLGFADPLEMTHRKIHIDSQNPSRTDTYINRSSNNMQLTDPIVATAALNNWREKTTSTLVVDKNGRGDYTTIQGAIDAINDSAPTNPYVVYIMPGVYDEKVDVDKSYISLIGIDREKSIISRNVTDRYMTVKVYSGGGPISNITIADLTIKNTNAWGGGGQAAQEAIAIGHPDEGANAVTDVRIDNCYLYGYQDTTFVYPNSEAIFENCYIYGGFDIASVWKATAKYFNCRLQAAHTSAAGIFFIAGSTVHVIDNWLESTQTGSKAAKLHNNLDILYFSGNYLAPNVADNPISFVGGATPTVYVAGSNGYNYINGITFLKIPSLDIDGNLEVFGNVGIGTNASSAKLHVLGDAGGVGPGGVGSDAPIGLNITSGKGGSAYVGDGGKGGDIFIVTSAGGAADGESVCGDGGDIYLRVGAGGTGPISIAGSYGNVLIADAGGKVGIGTTTPTHLLTVAGNANISGDLITEGGINVGTATGAAVGEIKTSGNISASGQRITAKLFDVEHYTGWLPTASSTYRGCLAFVEAGTGSNDKLYVCVKNADGSYAWDEIGQGNRIRESDLNRDP